MSVIPGPFNPDLEPVNGLRRLLWHLEQIQRQRELGGGEIHPQAFVAGPKREPPTFAEMMTVVDRRGRQA